MTAVLQHHEPSHSEGAAPLAGTPNEQRAAAASHLAHDARNWLTVLRVYCDLLRTSGAVVGQGRTWINELSNAVERGEGLVTSLLDSAQIAAAGETPTVESPAAGPKTLDLAEVIQRREALFRQLAGTAIDVQSKIISSAQTTSLQEAEFDRILLNLVRNGIDAMPHGGRLTIELENGVSSQGRRLMLRVSDTGNGIAADILPHIFESGFSTNSSARDPLFRRGYGLAIVRELTLAAGGSVRVRSRIGEGTSFTIEFPAEVAAATPRPTLVQARDGASASKQAPGQANNFSAHRKGTRVPC
jgi:two-component system, cell cycle sensor histidine kinase and response regulator CckA